jgi:hypothetical protein
MRLITFKFYFEHTEPIFRDLEILSIHQINCYLTSTFMFRYNHLENLPEIFNNYFTANYEIHNHNTRSYLNFTKLSKELTMQNILLLTKE